MTTKMFFSIFQNFQAFVKMARNFFFKIFQNFQVLVKMVPECQKNVFSKFSKIFKWLQNVARMATLWISQFSALGQMLPFW